MGAKDIVFVFGMGRSGSSALAGVLAQCGAAVSQSLLPADRANPTGYWEPMEALSLNANFLYRRKSSWHDPTLRLQGETVFRRAEQERFLDDIARFLEGFAQSRLSVIKEPRITALSDFWFEAARRAGFAVKIIVPLRHPAEVVASLAKRDALSAQSASALWLKYNLLAERKTRPFPRVFIDYSNLLDDWRKEIGRAAGRLPLDLDWSQGAKIDAMIDKTLRRERANAQIREVFGAPWLGRVYEALGAAARDEPVDRETLDEVFAAYADCERAFRAAITEFDARAASWTVVVHRLLNAYDGKRTFRRLFDFRKSLFSN